MSIMPQQIASPNERKSSIGGQTPSTYDSSSPPSSRSERAIEPVGRNDIELEMAMMMSQRMRKEGHQDDIPALTASSGSSVWSSSRYDSEEAETYAWSTSLHSSSSDDDSGSYSGSSSEDSSIDEESDDGVVAPVPRAKVSPQAGEPSEKKYPQPPADMMMSNFPDIEKKYPQPPVAMRGDPAVGVKTYPQAPPGMLEGLSFGFSLESIKRDLEKVGRAILSSNAGEIAAERAQTLASINWLASHVPNAVLDHLGHEIGRRIADENVIKEEEDEEEETSQDSMVASVVESDAMSDVSDLSQEQLNVDDDFALDEATNNGGMSPLRPQVSSEKNMADESEENLPGGISFLLTPPIRRTRRLGAMMKNLPSNPGGGSSPLMIPKLPGHHADDNSVSVSLSSSDDEIKKSSSKVRRGLVRSRKKRPPYSSDYRCALLFVDISGFTRLSTKLDPEALSKVRNAYVRTLFATQNQTNCEYPTQLLSV